MFNGFNNFIKAHLWKKDRKAINMTFNNKILHSFVPVFNDKTIKLCKALAMKSVESNKPFDISMNIFATTLDMVCGKCGLETIKQSVRFFNK